MKNIKIKFVGLLIMFLCVSLTTVFAGTVPPIPPPTPDTTPPVITLIGNTTVSITQGTTYVDAGATASDNVDGDITSKIVVTNPVNTALPATYKVTYNVKDAAGNGAIEVNRTVTVNPAPVHLNIKTDVDVPGSCSATDTDGVVHNYPKGSSYLAICALETAMSSGAVSGVQLSNKYPSLGLFITVISNVVADPTSQYWAILQNGGLAQLGITSLPVVAGDVIVLQLHDFSDNNLGDQVTLNIRSLVAPVSNVSSGSSGVSGGGYSSGSSKVVIPKVFDMPKALAYLESVQNKDGSFGDSLYTDWTTMAYSALDVTGTPLDTLLTYFNSHNTPSTLLTDNERHAMALLSLGQNPYSFNGINYIDLITKSFDGIQFGDPNLVNDDIFALIPLASSGYTTSDDIVTKDISFILSKQKSDGSWEESVDLTSAAIQALKTFNTVNGVSNSLTSAGAYISKEQGTDGGWGNVSSTSWALQAMNVLGASWAKNGITPEDYLTSQQVEDGAVSLITETLQNRIWATSYAIPGVLGKSWSAIMHSVPKPIQPIVSPKITTNLPIINPVAVKKPLPNKGITKINNLAANSVAAAVIADNTAVKPAPVQKESWLRIILKWLFGF